MQGPYTPTPLVFVFEKNIGLNWVKEQPQVHHQVHMEVHMGQPSTSTTVCIPGQSPAESQQAETPPGPIQVTQQSHPVGPPAAGPPAGPPSCSPAGPPPGQPRGPPTDKPIDGDYVKQTNHH